MICCFTWFECLDVLVLFVTLWVLICSVVCLVIVLICLFVALLLCLFGLSCCFVLRVTYDFLGNYIAVGCCLTSVCGFVWV